MREIWEDIQGFPGYEISSHGNVLNSRTNKPIKRTMNNRRLLMVGLTRDGEQHKRAVSLLVAKHYLAKPPNENFDSVIHLDGDRTNCHVDNLYWRPRWFTVLYHRQLALPPVINIPVEVITTEETFENSREVATKYGVLERDILTASLNGGTVWPTDYQIQRIKP